MGGSHAILYVGAALGGGAGLYLLYQILGELKELNRYYRRRAERENPKPAGASSHSGGHGSGHGGSSRGGARRPS